MNTLLERIIQSTSPEKQNIRVNNRMALLRQATISPAKSVQYPACNTRERFHLKMLEEIFRDIAYYYKRYKNNDPIAESRLDNAIHSLAGFFDSIKRETMERFLDSITEETEPYWFLVSTCANRAGIASDIGRVRLEKLLTGNNLLEGCVKTALTHSKADNLPDVIKPVFDQTTPAIKIDLLKILADRKEHLR